jgi:predicted TIM-barrel fold metal-dependent hydrolase
VLEELEIVDAHMHIFTAAQAERRRQRLQERDSRQREACRAWAEGFQSKHGSELAEENRDPPEKIARDWAQELERHGVDRAVFVALDPGDEELTAFLRAQAGRFYGLTTVDPRNPQAAALLRTAVQHEGYRGLKLYPTTQGFLPSDRLCYPLYEEARSLGIPILLHLGITLEYDSDLRFANPLELHPVLKDFPDVPFVVAHFGAGYFRELLFLAYHVNNLYVDTSGKNIWRRYLPRTLSLEEIFRKSLEVLGAERIIYGSDSRMLSRGYRGTVLREQLAALRRLRLAREEVALIMGGNALRLLKEGGP